jgi:hypothetical protein
MLTGASDQPADTVAGLEANTLADRFFHQESVPDSAGASSGGQTGHCPAAVRAFLLAR